MLFYLTSIFKPKRQNYATCQWRLGEWKAFERASMGYTIGSKLWINNRKQWVIYCVPSMI